MASPSPISKQQSVSNVGNRKRRNTYDIAHDSPPTKRIKSISAARITSNFPPQFWDNLSKVWLTSRALREKDRRNDIQPSAINPAIVRATPTSLARFARRGGPDLRHLRGYPEPKHAAPMSSNRSSNRRTLSTKATSVSSRAKRSSAYDKDFEQNLIDHNIYPEGFKHTDGRTTPEPKNLDSIVESLANPRASLSPSRFSILAFKSFRAANSRVISEGKVMADILPMIRGNSEILNEGNLPFANLESITNGTTVDAVPDWYDGSHTNEISKTVWQGLNNTIIPTSHAQAPVVPNFFIEAKAPRGGADVAKRQACLDGAVGARAMHSLQNYGEDVPICDSNAYAFSSTYHAGTGTLQLYAHHATGEEEQPEYHMTQIDSWGMTGNVDTFRRGATAFRNARDLARQRRETFIKAANARVSQEAAPAENMEQTYEHTSAYRNAPQAEAAAWQDSHDELQRYISESFVEDKDDGKAPTTPERQYTSDEEPDRILAASGTADPSMSVVSSSAALNTDTTRPKRARELFSSPTQGSRLSKSRSRAAVSRRPVVLPADTAVEAHEPCV